VPLETSCAPWGIGGAPAWNGKTSCGTQAPSSVFQSSARARATADYRMAIAKPAKLCAVTQAAFSDVPYILDSVWRWAEFEAYRLGRVNLKTCSFTLEHATAWPFFGAYLVISSLVVFGPTFTTLCNSFGPRAAEVFRWLLLLQLGYTATGRSQELADEDQSGLDSRARSRASAGVNWSTTSGDTVASGAQVPHRSQERAAPDTIVASRHARGNRSAKGHSTRGGVEVSWEREPRTPTARW